MSLKDKARRIPGVSAVEGAVTGALAEERDLPVARYDTQTADHIASKLNGFSQRELRLIDAYERKHQNRSTITDKIAKLTGDQPWSGYDEQSVEAISATLTAGDAKTAQEVKTYERGRKARIGVIESADKRIAG
jgi:SpoVK/Ycf46/Vps4 family AAA+-type ATPase